jgi:hypothetical protein
MKFNFKKIASVIASTVMLSSTVALAAAANYPSPFVQNGVADVAVVYGANAAQTDLVAATDITASLNSGVLSQVTTGGTATVTGGDSVKLARTSDLVNLGNDVNVVFSKSVTKDDLKTLLADGTYLNDANSEYKYEQKINLGSLNMSFFADSDYKNKEPTVGFKLADGVRVMNYTLDFTTNAETAVATAGDLTDLETTDLMILGKDYYILDAKNGTSGDYLGTFTLLDSANSVVVTEGESQTVTVGGKSYTISVAYIADGKVKLDVNGEMTNVLTSTSTTTFKLKDGTYVGIKEILYNSKESGVSKVEMSIGSGKLEISSGNDVELNDDSVSGLKGYIFRGSLSSGKQTMDKIVLTWDTDDTMFVSPTSDLVMPGFNAVKLSMGDFIVPKKELTEVNYDGDDSISLVVPIKDGTADFNILYASSNGAFIGLGKSVDEQLTTGATSLLVNLTSGDRDKWFVASWNSTKDAESYLLSATIEEKDGKNRTTIKNEVTGNNVCEDKANGDVCQFGSVSLNIIGVNKTGSSKWVTMTGGSGVSFDKVYTADGLKIALPLMSTINDTVVDGEIFLNSTAGGIGGTPGHNNNTYYLFMTETDKDDNVAKGIKFNATLGHDSDGNVHVTTFDTGQTKLDVPGSSDDQVSMVVSDLATKVTRTVSSDKGKLLVEYHGGEAYADVFLTSLEAQVSTSGSTAKVLPIKDSEAASVTANNLVVVGGSCINTVAADLLGGALCGADFEAKTGVGAGAFLIETFSRTGGGVATLVAGYNAEDTTSAAKYLTTKVVDTSVGNVVTKKAVTFEALA